ncbi:MAG: TRAP transporter substrate-binding protein [Synergistaceae bacterium]|jgi:tripartite ATP-independent transporter DctP family solute receptor|nr:TRAP transporter substrate-binding protein [Synergistaceae bacterium]
MKRVTFVFAIAAVLALLFCPAAFAADYTIRVGSINSEAHPDLVAMQEVFVPRVEKESGGKIKVELYPNGQLGGDREMSESVQLGTLQIAIPASSPLAGFDKRIQVLDLPYLFTSREAAFKALDGELGNKLNEYIAEKGLLNLGYQENGMRHVTNNKGPVKSPADLKGLKIRTMENPMHLAYFKELGANPTPMAWGELYTALQQGVVDAQENPYAMIVEGKFNEVQKYASETGHVFSVTLLLTNKKFIEGLPADLREIVVKAAKDTAIKQRELIAAEESSYKEQLEKAGMQTNELSAAEKKLFVEAAQKVYAQFEGELGKEIMDLVRNSQK